MKRRYDDKKESVKQYKKKIMWKIEQSDTQCKNVKYWEILKWDWYMKNANTIAMQELK